MELNFYLCFSRRDGCRCTSERRSRSDKGEDRFWPGPNRSNLWNCWFPTCRFCNIHRRKKLASSQWRYSTTSDWDEDPDAEDRFSDQSLFDCPPVLHACVRNTTACSTDASINSTASLRGTTKIDRRLHELNVRHGDSSSDKADRSVVTHRWSSCRTEWQPWQWRTTRCRCLSSLVRFDPRGWYFHNGRTVREIIPGTWIEMGVKRERQSDSFTSSVSQSDTERSCKE